MIPPTSIDGTDITGATIDGTDVTEITVDGDVVFTPAPPVPSLPNSVVHRWEVDKLGLSNGASVGTIPDQVGNRDLSNGGSPTYRTNEINGVDALEYDGVDDYHDNTNVFVGQPFYAVTVIGVIDPFAERIISRSQSNGIIMSTTSPTNSPFNQWAGSGFVNTNLVFANNSPAIFGAFFDGSNSFTRVNGNQVGGGNPGSNNMDGLRLAADSDFSPASTAFYFGELVVLDNPSTQDILDIDTILSNKWGISV